MELIERAADFGVKLTDKQSDMFGRYYELLTEYSQKFNLTSIVGEDEIYRLHFLDSLSGAFLFPQGATVADVGSGAGLPGLALAIARPDLRLTLIDSTRKKVDFQKTVCAELGLRCQCLHLRAEDAAKTLREGFDVTTARAVASLSTLCEYCLPLTKTGGRFVAYKSASVQEELVGAKRALELLGGGKCVLHHLTLSEGCERVLVNIVKVKPTPSKYPRTGNKPRISPL